MLYEYKKTEDNIPFREIRELGREGWLAALRIDTDCTILWVRELPEMSEPHAD